MMKKILSCAESQAIDSLIKKLTFNSSCINIIPNLYDKSFKEKIIQDFKIIISKPKGRELVSKIITSNKPLYIKCNIRYIPPAKRNVLCYNQDSNRLEMTLDPGVRFKVEAVKDNQKIEWVMPTYIILAHELIHVHHLQEGRFLTNLSYVNQQTKQEIPFLVKDNFKNLEEENTIIGIDLDAIGREKLKTTNITKINYPLYSEQTTNLDTISQNEFTDITEHMICQEHGEPCRNSHVYLDFIW